jgi:hypothetical protein
VKTLNLLFQKEVFCSSGLDFFKKWTIIGLDFFKSITFDLKYVSFQVKNLICG